MASYHPKKKYLSQQDVQTSTVNSSVNVSDQPGVTSAMCSTQSSSSLTSISRVSSLLLSDYQRNLSDNDLKFLGSPTFLGSFCSSGLSLDTIEKICSEQEAYNPENGESSTAVANYQHSLSLAPSNSGSLLGRDFILDDLALLASASSLHKSYSGVEELRISLARRDSAELAQDALLPSLPSLSSLSSLSEIELNAHPSTGSFSSILNAFDACEQLVTPIGSVMKNLLTGPEEQVQSAVLSDFLTAYDANSVKTRSPMLVPQNGSPIPTYRLKPSSSEQETENEYSPDPDADSSCDSAHRANDPVVYVKEEVEETSSEVNKQVCVTTSGRNRGSGKSREPKYECQVCGDVAAGFHCGAYVCEACKKFYLRCLKTRGAPAFLCPKNNDCDITKDTRSHCQFCRFQKCISLGMYKPGHEDDKKLKINFKVIPCKVCNAPSSGFHFGAITCEGCKGFFRRMLKEQLHKKFICVNDEPCNIDSANRTTCKCCRFEKCLKVGMTLDGTRLGRQSNSVKRRTLMQYIANDESNVRNDSRHSCANVKTTENSNFANSESASGLLEDAEDSSEPLCINFPRGRSSCKRRLSNSSDNSVQDNGTHHLEMQNFEGVERLTEGEADFLHWRGARKSYLSPQPKTHLIEENQNLIYVPLDKRKVSNDDEYRNSRENSTSFRSAVDETSDSFCCKKTSNLAGRNTPYSNRSLDKVGSLSGQVPPKFYGHHGNWNNSMSDRVQLYTAQLGKISGRNLVSLRPGVNTEHCLAESSYVSSAGTNQNITDASESTEYQGLGGKACGTSSVECSTQPVPSDSNILNVFKTPEILFGHLVTAFRELEDINLRPSDLDELHCQPVSMQTIWKLVEIPFIHQSKTILKFIKKLPGFRLLAVEDQIIMARDSLYPVVLLYHSRSYDLETEEFSWFICSPKERDLVLSVLTPFRSMANHFRSIGHIIKRLNLTEEEMAFIASMTVLTASEGFPLKSGNKVAELQDALVDAFISYQQRDSGGNRNRIQERIGKLLARLPELKRANIEHRLIIAQVEQMIPEIEISNLYREIFLSG